MRGTLPTSLFAALALCVAGGAATASAQSPAGPEHAAIRAACTASLTTLTNAIGQEGKTRLDAAREVDLLVQSFAARGPDRDQILSAVSDAIRAEGLTPRRRAELEASACVAIAGTAFDAGMTEASELRTYWNARRTTVIPAAETGPQVNACVTADYGKSVRGEPFLLRNRCDYPVTAAYCLLQARPGSPSEEVSCEQDRYAIYDIKPHHAAMIVFADGGGNRWYACRPPFRPRVWWQASETAAKGVCEK